MKKKKFYNIYIRCQYNQTLFSLPLTKRLNKLERFFVGKPFQPSLVFVGKVGAYPVHEINNLNMR
jgi:hypothetical protein